MRLKFEKEENKGFEILLDDRTDRRRTESKAETCFRMLSERERAGSNGGKK